MMRGRSASTGKHLHHEKSGIFSPETGSRRMEAADMSVGQIKKCIIKEHICMQTDSVGVEGREEGIEIPGEDEREIIQRRAELSLKIQN